MLFEEFKKRYFNYKGRGIEVKCPYVDKNVAADICIIGSEKGGGLQNCYVRNKNGVCSPIYLPGVWYQKVDPENYRLNNGDIELLCSLNLEIGIVKSSIKDYLEGKHKYIELYPTNEHIKNVEFLEPNCVNSFIEEIYENKPNSFQIEEEPSIVEKCLHPTVDI